MYNRLITLGCSITNHPGWATHISNTMKLPLINLSESSGSNTLQQFRFQELIFKDKITSNDIIIWQITGIERSYLRKLKNSNLEQQEYLDETSTIYSKNIFDNKERIDFLSHSSIALQHRFETPSDLNSCEQDLENLLFYIISAKHMTPNVFVVYGWKSAVSEEYKSIFEYQLFKYDIKMFKNPIVDWCANNNLDFMDDNMHPTVTAYANYCDNYMYPRLKEFLDANHENKSNKNV